LDLSGIGVFVGVGGILAVGLLFLGVCKVGGCGWFHVGLVVGCVLGVGVVGEFGVLVSYLIGWFGLGLGASLS